MAKNDLNRRLAMSRYALTWASLTAATIAKRQSLQIVQDTATDFDAYYAQNRYTKEEDTTDLLVISG